MEQFSEGSALRAPVLRLLVVAADVDGAAVLGERLRRVASSATVERCGTLSDAVDRLGEERFDLVLADLSLAPDPPEDLIALVRSVDPTIAIVAVVGPEDTETGLRVVAAGAEGVVRRGEVDEAGLAALLGRIVDRVRGRLTLEASEQFNRSVIEAIPAATVVLDATGEVVARNAEWERHLGAADGPYGPTADGQRYLDVLAASGTSDADRAAAAIAAILAGRQGTFEGDVVVGHGDRSRCYTVGANRLSGGVGAVVCHTDVTDRVRAEAESAHRALHDGLTGLPNRKLLEDRLAQALAVRARSGTDVAVIFLDLDGFKAINDALGHPIGDRVLIAFADRVRTILRSADTLARFGGDEFVVVCADLDGPGHLLTVIDRIRAALAPALVLEGTELDLSATMGAALAGEHPSAEDLLHDADAAMYRAKRRGRGEWEIFDEDMRHDVAERLALESGLRRSVEREELRLVYQPVIDLDAGRLVGFEALVRWQRPDGRLAQPDEFMGAAEDTGVVVELGEWVADHAVQQLRAWVDEWAPDQPLTMGINISARQFRQPEYATRLASIVGRAGVDPSLLLLEVTERVLMDESDQTRVTLDELQALGVRLAIDDFGTGYSSLSYLRRLPVDTVKIDRSFVDRLGHEAEATAIVGAIVQMAEALGLAVVGEGVETARQRDELMRLGCRSAQGFLLGRPAEAARWSAESLTLAQ